MRERTAALTVARRTLELAPQDETALAFVKPSGRASAQPWIDRSLAFYTAHRYRAAIDAANHALSIDASSAIAYNNVGAAEVELRNWETAIAADRKALALDPSLKIARNNLSWALTHR